MEISKMPVSRMTSEEVKIITNNSHGVSIPCLWNLTGNWWANPCHGIQVEDIDIVEALFSIITTKHVQLSPNS
jgi:hypothetical protein